MFKSLATAVHRVIRTGCTPITRSYGKWFQKFAFLAKQENCFNFVVHFAASLPTRFYKNASILNCDGKYEIILDNRKLKTPIGAPFYVTSEPLALASKLFHIEWNRNVYNSLYFQSLWNGIRKRKSLTDPKCIWLVHEIEIVHCSMFRVLTNCYYFSFWFDRQHWVIRLWIIQINWWNTTLWITWSIICPLTQCCIMHPYVFVFRNRFSIFHDNFFSSSFNCRTSKICTNFNVPNGIQ